MVFVTVGTHEQQFDRLVRAADELAAKWCAYEHVVIQTGYSQYEPKHCEWARFYPYQMMHELVERASAVVTHGGPSSFMEVRAMGKVPVVVPRVSRYGEHVNDHQVEFVRAIAQRQGGIVPVYDVADLETAIGRVQSVNSTPYAGHTAEFCEEFARLVDECLAGRKKR